MEREKYIILWEKYLPVIRIHLKNSFQKDQTIELSKIEFEAAGDRDAAGYTFNLEIEMGKVINDIRGSAVARDLYSVLSADRLIKEFLKDKKVKIGLRKNFVLTLKTADV